MKNIYLNDLKEKLESNSVENAYDILTKIEKRYNLGLEAGLDEEEIEEMLGSVDDIVNQYTNVTVEEKKEKINNEEKVVSLEISSVSDNLTIEFDDIKDIEYELINVNVDCYDISYEKKEFKLKYKKAKFLALNRKESGHIIVKLPNSIKYEKVSIHTTSGEVVIKDELTCKIFKLNTVSGDVALDNVSSNYIKLSTVSGDITSLSLTGDEIYIDTVSGDMGSNVVNCDNLGLSTVSGDINITNAKASIKASSVSGDINVNGSDIGVSFKKTIKGIFR